MQTVRRREVFACYAHSEGFLWLRFTGVYLIRVVGSRPPTSVWHMESIVKAVGTAVSRVGGRMFKVQGFSLYAYRQLSLWGRCAKRRRI